MGTEVQAVCRPPVVDQLVLGAVLELGVPLACGVLGCKGWPSRLLGCFGLKCKEQAAHVQGRRLCCRHTGGDGP